MMILEYSKIIVGNNDKMLVLVLVLDLAFAYFIVAFLSNKLIDKLCLTHL